MIISEKGKEKKEASDATLRREEFGLGDRVGSGQES